MEMETNHTRGEQSIKDIYSVDVVKGLDLADDFLHIIWTKRCFKCPSVARILFKHA